MVLLIMLDGPHLDLLAHMACYGIYALTQYILYFPNHLCDLSTFIPNTSFP